MQRDSRRWKTRFGRWIGHVGVREVVRRLNVRGQLVTEKAVYHWLAGRHVPRDECATAIVRSSRGQVSRDDISLHRSALVSEKSSATS